EPKARLVGMRGSHGLLLARSVWAVASARTIYSTKRHGRLSAPVSVSRQFPAMLSLFDADCDAQRLAKCRVFWRHAEDQQILHLVSRRQICRCLLAAHHLLGDLQV